MHLQEASSAGLLRKIDHCTSPNYVRAAPKSNLDHIRLQRSVVLCGFLLTRWRHDEDGGSVPTNYVARQERIQFPCSYASATSTYWTVAKED